MVVVNTVVLAQGQLKLTQNATAMALAAFGAGSMLVALGLPKLLERLPDRRVMLVGAAILSGGLFLGLRLPPSFGVHSSPRRMPG
jgi:predicted MFS family arabinose efflux permease